MNKIPMTAQGAERLREELTRLKQVERLRISAAIGEAMEMRPSRRFASSSPTTW